MPTLPCAPPVFSQPLTLAAPAHDALLALVTRLAPPPADLFTAVSL